MVLLYRSAPRVANGMRQDAILAGQATLCGDRRGRIMLPLAR